MNRIFRLLTIVALSVCSLRGVAAENFISFTKGDGTIEIARNNNPIAIYQDPNEHSGVGMAIENLKKDLTAVTGNAPQIIRELSGKRAIIVCSADASGIAKELFAKGVIDKKEIEGKTEKFIIKAVKNPLSGIDEALIIMGSDKRGTIYGIYELSKQIGISPWYYWADAPIMKNANIYAKLGGYTDGEPAVKYRGIFLNDEWPCLGNWTHSNFKGFKTGLYEKVFELLLRLKGNFMWPAMWSGAFYADDDENSYLANEMGIIMGTSHHEPMARAHAEWSRNRKSYGEWNYATNQKVIDQFFREGIERMKNTEDVVTIGMRGDGDAPMSKESNIELLEMIIANQRKTIEQVTGKPAKETPQVWALYKEVQDYYDQGMRVPDDVTLLLCDNNWGDVRKLPELDAKPRKGGYGMYYHFDYVGAPRNYKWLNVSQIQKVWEQMTLCYEYGVKELWIVNVGDLKPMEFPISFFMDMAWSPERFNENNLYEYTIDFCRQQFGDKYAEQTARMLNLYCKYNARVTPEILNEKTYSLSNYDEFRRVRDDYNQLAFEALQLYYLLPEVYRDSYDQLLLYPIQAMANLYDMYYSVAMNRDLAAKKSVEANVWADRVDECFARDSVLSYHYNKVMSNGKWNHMMTQTHIGYTTWNDPKGGDKKPDVTRVEQSTEIKSPLFAEGDGYISIEAANFARKQGNNVANIVVVPGMGKTESALIMKPSAIKPQTDTKNGVYVEYDIDVKTPGKAKVTLMLSPSLNFNGNRGLRYAISVDGGKEQVVNINKDYNEKQEYKWHHWQRERINKTTTEFNIDNAGLHTVRVRFIDPGVVVQKILVDMGGLKPSFLGAPQSKIVTQ